MAKKKKSEKEELIYYVHKKDGILFKADSFIYEMCVYELIGNNGYCMYECKETSVNEFKGYLINENVIKGKKKFLKSIELIGAPIEFLKDNYFKELN